MHDLGSSLQSKNCSSWPWNLWSLPYHPRPQCLQDGGFDTVVICLPYSENFLHVPMLRSKGTGNGGNTTSDFAAALEPWSKNWNDKWNKPKRYHEWQLVTGDGKWRNEKNLKSRDQQRIGNFGGIASYNRLGPVRTRYQFNKFSFD